MRLGIGSYTCVWAVGVPGYPQPEEPLTAFGLLDQAKELGVRVVQIADNLPLHRLGESKLERLHQQATEAGIAIEVGTGGIGADKLLRYLAIATRLGSPILRTVIDADGERPAPDEVVARLAPLMPEFEHAGVTLALENHDRFRAVVLRDIVERLRSPGIGVCLDTANSLGCLEGPEHVAEVLGPHTVNLHLKDVRAFRPPHHKGFVVEGCAAGAGPLDITGLLTRLRERGARGNAIVELWPAPEPVLADAVAKEKRWTRESVGYLRTLIPD
jgi:sugar phosphate isomerase/epimerase